MLGKTVYWIFHNGRGDDPRREGILVAIYEEFGWVASGSRMKTVELDKLSLEKVEP